MQRPLADEIRPKGLEEVVGQRHIIGKDKLLYRAIKADKLSSIILYGPPGTGKTTLAKVIANTTSAEFTQINATVAGKKDMEAVVAKAKDMQGMYGRKTILFIDEIHRFNKGQQDYLLPFVEDGTLILIGAMELEKWATCGVAFLLLLVGFGVNQIVNVCIIQGGYQKLLQEGDYTPEEKQFQRRTKYFSAAYWTFITGIFLLISLYHDNWDASWIIWPVAALFFAALRGILHMILKNNVK